MGPQEEDYHSNDPQPAKRLTGIVDNVWEWAFRMSSQSPVQPIVNLGHGMIEFNPPPFIVQAHQNALLEVDCNQYGPTLGRTRLKTVLATTYSRLYDAPLDGDKNIAITTGATAAILSSLMAFIEHGDEVIVIEPLFNLYAYLINFVGGVIKPVTLHPPTDTVRSRMLADDWWLNMKELGDAIGPRTKMLIINTPHNPLGKVFSPEELRSIGDLCVARNIIILADEVYERLHYTPTYPRIATLSPQIAARTISIGSVGKTFNATGWRVGYAIGNENLIKHVQWAHVLLSYVTPGPAQEAAAAAYEDPRSGDFFNDNRTLFKQKIDIFCQILDDLGLTYFVPSGAYFILVNISTLRLPSSFELPAAISKKGMDWKMSYYMCHELGVSSIPGSAFFLQEHAALGESFVRFVVCKTDEQIELAKTRLQGLKALTSPSPRQLTPLRGKL